MKLELRSIQHNEYMSEETYCFSAKLFVDDVHAFDVSNRGHGGPDNVCATGKSSVTEACLNQYLAKNPPSTWKYPFNYDLEMLVADLVTDGIARNKLKGLMKRHIVATDGQELYTYKLKSKITSQNLPPENLDGLTRSLADMGRQLVTPDLNYDLALKLLKNEND